MVPDKVVLNEGWSLIKVYPGLSLKGPLYIDFEENTAQPNNLCLKANVDFTSFTST